MHMDGPAGCGKTYAILLASRDLEQQANATFSEAARTPIIQAALFGVMAHNITGYTLHALFQLPMCKLSSWSNASNMLFVDESTTVGF